eukprot:SAG31_NODE_554_length_14181_cov_22.378000_4_plen_388_part_00
MLVPERMPDDKSHRQRWTQENNITGGIMLVPERMLDDKSHRQSLKPGTDTDAPLDTVAHPKESSCTAGDNSSGPTSARPPGGDHGSTRAQRLKASWSARWVDAQSRPTTDHSSSEDVWGALCEVHSGWPAQPGRTDRPSSASQQQRNPAPPRAKSGLRIMTVRPARNVPSSGHVTPCIAQVNERNNRPWTFRADLPVTHKPGSHRVQPSTRGFMQPLRGTVVPERMHAKLGGQARPRTAPDARPRPTRHKNHHHRKLSSADGGLRRWYSGVPRSAPRQRDRVPQHNELQQGPSLDRAIAGFLDQEEAISPDLDPPECEPDRSEKAPPAVSCHVGQIPLGMFEHLEPNFKALAAFERWQWWPAHRPHPLDLIRGSGGGAKGASIVKKS